MSSQTPTGLADFDHLPDASHVNFDVVKCVTGLGRTAIYRHINQGRLPKPLKFTPGSSRWNVGELRAALRALKEGAA